LYRRFEGVPTNKPLPLKIKFLAKEKIALQFIKYVFRYKTTSSYA
jgi:hypothetical protein